MLLVSSATELAASWLGLLRSPELYRDALAIVSNVLKMSVVPWSAIGRCSGPCSCQTTKDMRAGGKL